LRRISSMIELPISRSIKKNQSIELEKIRCEVDKSIYETRWTYVSTKTTVNRNHV
jgi:hypothetical protein